jgi:hypothetical protein
MSSSNEPTEIKDDYKSVQASAPTVTPVKKTKVEKPGWLKRKYIKIKTAAGEFWVVGKYGFQLGGIVGLLFGFVLGSIQAVSMKSFWPIPIAMAGSGFTFGCMFAISTVLRSHGENDMKTEKLAFQTVYYDEVEGKYKRKIFPLYKDFKH